MNKMLKNVLLYTFLAIILMIPYVIAYSSTDLKAYYSFEDTNLNKLIDSGNNYNFTITSNFSYSTTNGIILKALASNGSVSAVQYNTTIFNVNNGFTINFWIKHNSTTNSEVLVSVKNDTGTSYLTSKFGTSGSNSLLYVGSKGSSGTNELSYIYTNSNDWNMITITYVESTKTLQLYENAQLKDTNTNITLRSNSNKLYLGLLQQTTQIDELLILNTSINVFDITALYNNGVGLNYTNSLNVNATLLNTTPVCIDNYNLCNNPLIINNDYYCDVLDTVYCADECINSNISGIYSGTCNNLLCTNECNIIGYQECNSINSFQICGNYDTDNCLEYSGDFGCTLGSICSNGYCINNTGIGLTNNTLFTVTPYSISSDSTIYSLDTSKKILYVDSKNLFQAQQFSTNTNAVTSYSSRSCDYEETIIGRDIQNIETNTTQTIVFSAIAQPVYIDVNVLPVDNVYITIKLSDTLGNQINNITLLRNVSAKSLCYYNSSLGLIYCDYSINSYDDLDNVRILYNLEFQSKTYTITFTSDRYTDYTFSTQPKVFNTNDISQIDIITTNATYYNSSVTTYTQPSAFSTTLKSNYNYLMCTYTKNGCNVVRTYNNYNGISDFTNYYDYTICINSLNNANPSSDSTTGDIAIGKNLTASEKYLIILIVLIVTIATGVGVGYSVKNGMAGLIIGCVVAVFELITFVAFKWINGWVIAVMVICALAIITIVNTLGNSNSSG